MLRASSVHCFSILVALSGAACTSDGGREAPSTGDGECKSFDSTFDAIQTSVFEGQGCTNDTCHGSARSGGLDLRAGFAYSELLEKKSTGTSLVRVQPGAPTESYLYLKLAAATNPDADYDIANSPMPVGLPPLSPERLEAVRLWIQGGAPEKGAVGDPTKGGTSDTIANLLSVCLPPAEPVKIAPLEAPPPDEGIQFTAPTWRLGAGKEREVCVASYYDFSDRVPDEFKSPDGKSFYTNGSRLRQNPASHHYILSNPLLEASFATDPSFGGWRCYGGDRPDAECDPLDAAACGDGGTCGSELKDNIACLNYGPVKAGFDGFLGAGLIENVQSANQYLPPRDGVYRELPIKGFLYHNTHGFNLTDQEAEINSRLNVLFAKDRKRRLVQAIDYSMVGAAAGIAPYTTKEICGNHVAPSGAELIRLTSHTHKRGKRFWVTVPGGEMIYESFIYSDPLYKEFEPSIRFDGASDDERTLRICALFNNGVAENGSPDPEAVTRASRMPDRTTCKAVACTAGKVGAACAGADDGASCDSAPGEGDGVCDACAITAGATTENEMFVVMPWYLLPEGQ